MTVRVYHWDSTYCETDLELKIDNVQYIERVGGFYHFRRYGDFTDICVYGRDRFLRVEEYPDDFPF